jgi:tetratricopeptide (TPR) repeat protein
MRQKKILGYVLIGMALAGCKTLDINGMVYDFSNKPVPNYTVRLTKRRRYNSTTDINGRFLLARTRAGTYEIRGEKDGYEVYQGTIEIHDRGQIIYIRVPSQGQLLELTDEALGRNQIGEAETYIERAYQAGPENTELLFYYAVIKFRQKKYNEARAYLQRAKDNGSRDEYVERFLNDLIRIQAK